MFNDSGKCLETSNSLVLVGGSDMGDSTLGEHHFGEFIDIVQLTLSLRGAEDTVTWIQRWASDRYMLASSWASEISGCGPSWAF